MEIEPDHGDVDRDGDRDDPNAGFSTDASSPIVVGWDPDTGTWADGSPIAAVLRELRDGVALEVAGTFHGVPHIEENVARGRRFLDRPVTSVGRWPTPIDERPFVDLAQAVARAEAEAELRLTDVVFRAALYDPRLTLQLLERRAPEGWDPKCRPVTNVEPDQLEDEYKRVASLPQFAIPLAEIWVQMTDYLDAERRSGGAAFGFE